MLAFLLVGGAAFGATRHCDGGRCKGTDEADKIYVSEGDDVVFADAGSDKVFGRGGEDVLKGDSDDDHVYGEEDNDRVKGGPGRDMVFGGPGDDMVRGGTHDETNDGVRDVLDCGEGTADSVYYTPGVDVIRDCEIFHPPKQ